MNDPVATPSLRTPRQHRPSAAEVATRTAKRGTAKLVAVASEGFSLIRAKGLRAVAARQLRAADGPIRLCLGSGHAPIDGWVNIDFEPPADVLVDLRYGLPVQESSVALIYSEHLVEHMPVEAGVKMFRELRRVIAPDGVVRIATPDLALLITDYRGDWRSRHEWVAWPEYQYIDTPVRMINVAMRAWGHQYLYDFDELALRLRSAGFSDVQRTGIGESPVPELRGLETRADSYLVVEARP